MMNETRYVHVFKVNINLIKKRRVSLYPEVGLVPEVPDAPLPTGADMLDWSA
jgi:hypothetical protein